MTLRRLAVLTSAMLLGASMSLSAAEIVHVKGKTGEPASLVAVDNLVFLSGISGTTGDLAAQVDEVIRKTNEALAARGLDIGDMLQHTLYIRDGASPMAALQRFHGTATAVAPSLKIQKSVGTIVRLPEFPDSNTLVMLDMVAGAPRARGDREEFKRMPFTFGPAEISETITARPFIFTAGTEAMNFENGSLQPGLEDQVNYIVEKLVFGLKKAGVGPGAMISHNLYVRKGTDPIKVIQLFHSAMQKLAPELKEKPSVGTLVVVDGMASDGFLMEMDAIAVPASTPVRRVPNTDHPEIANSVEVRDLVLLAGTEAAQAGQSLPEDAAAQAVIVARKIDQVLRESGLTIGDMVKYKLYVKTGSNVAAVREAFLQEAARLGPALRDNPAAETLAIVEGLAGEPLKVEVSAIAARR